MISVRYKPSFLRILKKTDLALRIEVYEKAELFRHRKNHSILKVHKLKGAFKGLYAFSVNFKFRVIFEYESSDAATLIDFGDHAIYD